MSGKSKAEVIVLSSDNLGFLDVFYFVLFYFILFYFILFYFIVLYCIDFCVSIFDHFAVSEEPTVPFDSLA